MIWGKNGEGEGTNKELHRHVYGRSRLCEGEVIEGILSMNFPSERDLVNSKADLLFLLLEHGIIYFLNLPKDHTYEEDI